MRGIFCFLGAAALVTSSIAQEFLVAIDPVGDTMYSIDPVTGDKTVVTHPDTAAQTIAELAFDPVTSALYASSTTREGLYHLTFDGGAVRVNTTPWDSSVFMHGLAWDATTGKLFGASSTQAAGGTLYDVDPTSGNLTRIGVMGTAGFTEIAFDTDTNTMYATGSGGPTLYTVDRTTGAATQLLTITGGPQSPSGMAYDPANQTMYITDNVTDALYTLNLSTGAATQLTTFTASPNSNVLSLVYLPVPEPATLAGIGIAGLTFVRRRRR